MPTSAVQLSDIENQTQPLPTATETTPLVQSIILTPPNHSYLAFLKNIGPLLVGLGALEFGAAFFAQPQFKTILALAGFSTAALGGACACTYFICPPPDPGETASQHTTAESVNEDSNIRSPSPSNSF